MRGWGWVVVTFQVLLVLAWASMLVAAVLGWWP